MIGIRNGSEIAVGLKPEQISRLTLNYNLIR